MPCLISHLVEPCSDMGRLAVLVFVVVSAGTAHGKVICDATQSDSCYGTQGEPVYLQLTRKTSEYELRLTRNNIRIFSFKKIKTNFYNTSLTERLMFFSANGTLRINPVELTDMWMYAIQVYHTNGTLVASYYLTLTVNEMTPMTQTISNTTHTTRYNSTQLEPKKKWNMEQFGVILIIVGVLGSVLCLTTLGGLFYRHKKRSSTYRAAEHVEVELEYADVSILRSPRRQPERRERRERREDTVEYGEVKVQKAHTPVQQEECVSMTVYSALNTRSNRESLQVYFV